MNYFWGKFADLKNSVIYDIKNDGNQECTKRFRIFSNPYRTTRNVLLFFKFISKEKQVR